MPLTQQYTAITGDVITAARWNNEFGNIYNNMVPLLDTYGMKNVKDDYSAVADGVTSDQSAVVSAVSAAYAGGFDLYWPVGTYLTTATIANFHDVQHRGPGILKRGSTLFYVDPSVNPGVTNNLYVATTGVDTNDGLASSQPLLTAQAAGDLVYNYSYGDVTWKIQFAAGTYVGTASFPRPFPSPNWVQFLGPAVANGVVPTAIMDSPGGANAIGLFFHYGARAYIEDLAFTDYKDGGSPASGGLGAGVVSYRGAHVYTKNVHASNCDNGIKAQGSSLLFVEAGVLSGNAWGIVVLSNVHFTIGTNGTAADITGATGPSIINNTVSGVHAQEGAHGHVDYAYLGSNGTGVSVVSQSRVHLLGSTVISNTLGVELELNSVLYDSPSEVNTYTTNTDDIRTRSGSLRTGTIASDNYMNAGFVEVETAQTGTQSATPVTYYTWSFAAKEFGIRGAGFCLSVHANYTGTADTKNITITLGGSTLLNQTIAATTTDVVIEIELFQRLVGSLQRCTTRVFQNGVVPAINVTGFTEDMTAAVDLIVKHNVVNVADTSTIQTAELRIRH